MAHLRVFLFTLILIISSSFIPAISSLDRFSRPLSQREWGVGMPQFTKLKFYFHDTVSGPNETAWPIVPPPKTQSIYGFGSVTMIDDPLTKGKNIDSKLVGRAQGLYASADLNKLGLLMVMNFVFAEGSGYENSTLSVLGRNDVFSVVREMPVVGGTGKFRFAKGFAQASTVQIDAVTAVVEYNVQVIHF